MNAPTPVIKTEVHPIDVMLYEKGHYFPPAICEQIVSMKRENRKYGMALVKLCTDIALAWFQYREEEIITVMQIKDGIKILTDEEAVVYNRQCRIKATRLLDKSFKRLGGVDRENLSTKSREEHSRQLCITGAMIQGARKEKQIALKSYKRQTPGLPGK